MGIYTRSNSPFWQYKDPQIKPRSTGVKKDTATRASLDRSKRKAEKVVEGWKENLAINKMAVKLGMQDQLITPIKVKDLVLKFLIRLERRGINKDSTLTWQKSSLSKFAQLYGDHYIYHSDPQVPQINKNVILEFHDLRAAEGMAPKTLNDNAKMIRRLIDEAKLRDHSPIDRINPVDLIQRISPGFFSREVKNPHKPIPTELIQEAVKNAEREIDQLFWSLMFYTGLDSGDAGTLTKENVLSDRIVKLRNKEEKAERWQIIPLHQSLQGIDLTNIMPVSTRRDHSRTVLQKLTGGHKCKGDTGYCLKCLRHTFATNLAHTFHKMGLTDSDVGLAMGHKKKTITDRYIHLESDFRSPLPENLVKAVQRLPVLT